MGEVGGGERDEQEETTTSSQGAGEEMRLGTLSLTLLIRYGRGGKKTKREREGQSRKGSLNLRHALPGRESMKMGGALGKPGPTERYGHTDITSTTTRNIRGEVGRKNQRMLWRVHRLKGLNNSDLSRLPREEGREKGRQRGVRREVGPAQKKMEKGRPKTCPIPNRAASDEEQKGITCEKWRVVAKKAGGWDAREDHGAARSRDP